VTAFVLKYRVGTWDGRKNKYPIPFMDATRAVRLARTRAREWGVNPERIGIMGFSAGGHLASTVGTHFDGGNGESADAVERTGSRPNFMILVYPVISFKTEFVHRGSRKSLLGENADPRLVESLSNETQVTSMTPPTFLVATDEDDAVPAENSVLFYLALRRAKVPAELHIYRQGGHGFGMTSKDPVIASWVDRCRDWMKGMGLLDGK
jgi:acetyl esterase/lipase